MDEILINTQLALFFENPLSRPDEFSQLFDQQMEGIFDQIPIVMPVPNEIQLLDIPVVQMNSKNGVHSCNIARGRVDFFHAGVGKQTFVNIKEAFLKEVERFFIFFSDKVKIKRIGFVTRFFIEYAEQDKIIATKLLNEEFRKIHGNDTDFYESYIKYVSRNEINEFKINNFTTVEKFSARIFGFKENLKGVLITRDFNTIPEENYKDKLLSKEIGDFIENGVRKFRLEDIKKILWE